MTALDLLSKVADMIEGGNHTPLLALLHHTAGPYWGPQAMRAEVKVQDALGLFDLASVDRWADDSDPAVVATVLRFCAGEPVMA